MIESPMVLLLLGVLYDNMSFIDLHFLVNLLNWNDFDRKTSNAIVFEGFE